MENIAPVDRRETSSVCVLRHCIYEDILEASILSHCGFHLSQARGSCVSIQSALAKQVLLKLYYYYQIS